MALPHPLPTADALARLDLEEGGVENPPDGMLSWSATRLGDGSSEATPFGIDEVGRVAFVAHA